MRIGNHNFNLEERTYIMGILNVTPDSFSDGGRYPTMDKALERAEKLVAEGADILDIGGESTRLGHEPVPEALELERVIPIIEAVRARMDIPISIDTYKSRVAEEAVKVGADMINDVYGFLADDQMAALAARTGVVCCLMHNRDQAVYDNFLQDVLTDLQKSIHLAEAAGVEESRIIIDPGIGFGKDYHHNLEILNHLEQLHTFGYPVLLGTSRKRTIGTATEEPVPENRDIGTAATTAIAVMKGCQFVRVHNVAMNKKAAMMAECIKKADRHG